MADVAGIANRAFDGVARSIKGVVKNCDYIGAAVRGELDAFSGDYADAVPDPVSCRAVFGINQPTTPQDDERDSFLREKNAFYALIVANGIEVGGTLTTGGKTYTILWFNDVAGAGQLYNAVVRMN